MNTGPALVVNGNGAKPTLQGPDALPIAAPQPVIVTTSWDDGDPHDLAVARMLADRRMAGTFYIPIKGHHPYARMDRAGMLSLDAQGFEIGAHGVSHPNLPQCDASQLDLEVVTCKKRLEDDLSKEVSVFAYPNGRHNSKVIASVRQAGFVGARTTTMLGRELVFDPFRMPTSIQAFPHSRLNYLKNFLTSGDFRRSWSHLAGLFSARDWVGLATHLFDTVLANGGVWHLYGHSWEINDFRLWDDLRVVLDYISNRPGVLYLPNSELVRLVKVQPIESVLSPSAGPKVDTQDALWR
jgi:peptidoglycan/xylan/chitin deacetylase (PgdA/CDA1 family)